MSIRNHIPNAVTCLNLVCGVLGIVFAIQNRLDCAMYAMLLGAVFDFCDGLVARSLKAGSEFGKQLDSLSDAITFGLLPGLMFTMYMVSDGGIIYIGETAFTSEPQGWSVWACVPLLLPVFAALRLAKFNVTAMAQTTSFLGLPTPASALLCGCLTYYVFGHPDSLLAIWARGPIFLPVLSVVLCALMVSRIPMFSLKFNSASSASPSQKMAVVIAGVIIVAIIVVLLCLGMHISLIATILLALYPLYNIVRSIKKTEK